ncbi:hypothetical protein B0F90DRAFT_419973 [Multifurca ochricompacta]|uniref:Uncharacterized protein n=1 Tax=Multifurca ochricompacta TaxID=376703 RepID=A0AAD4QNC2_9AGAM|nr:hypothetical protein B0F90DRAFT_419973 [Multifurca ochricompacta]
MKAVRSQEEKFDTLRHRRKNVASKADSAERKLSKMDPGHKNTPAQSDLLLRLREEIRDLDSEIMTEEAKLGDLKRTATKAWMTLKFGGLQEYCQKGLIIAETGKLIMSELPQVETEPGSARQFYVGQARTETYVAEGLRALGEVQFDASAPSGRVPQVAIHQNSSPNLIIATSHDTTSGMNDNYGVPPIDSDGPLQYHASRTTSLAEQSSYANSQATFQTDELGTLLPQSDVPRSQTFHAPPNPPSLPSNSSLRDDLPTLSQQIGSPAPPGGRFATFPVKGKRQSSLAPAISEPQESLKSTFTEEVEQALSKGDPDDPVPQYEAVEGVHAPPLGAPPGAAPPAMPRASLYESHNSGAYDSGPSHAPSNAGEAEEDSQLPYVETPQSERRIRFGSRPIPMPRPWSHFNRATISLEQPNEREPASTDHERVVDPVQESSALNQGEGESSASPQATVSQDRIPTPPSAKEEPQDEQALNAAAAREVSRELDAFMYSPPVILPRTPSPKPLAPAPLSIPPVTHQSPRSSDSITHPSSPFTRGRNRAPESPTASRSSAEQLSPVSVSPSPLVTSVPSSPTQQPPLPPPSIALPKSSSPSLSSISNSSFRPPPELLTTPSPNISQRTLPLPPGVSPTQAKASPLPPPGTRTISAAAFRRPTPRKSETLIGSPDINPLPVKRRDPRGSPYAPRLDGAFGSTSSLPSAQAHELAPPLPPDQNQEDEFDYISAYYVSGGDELNPPPAIIEPRARSSSLR